MERRYILPHEGKFYKANLHAHTVVSDGMMTKEETKAYYKSRGYSVYAFTDHNVCGYYPELDDEDFLTLRAIEVDAPRESSQGFPRTSHFCAIAREPGNTAVIPREGLVYTPESINAHIRAYVEAGYIVNYNHPYWSNETMEDVLKLTGYSGLEIYNHLSETMEGNGDCRSYYDLLLKQGKRIYCLATDDNHLSLEQAEEDGVTVDGGFVMIKAKALNYADVIAALDRGEFYSSTGPEIYEWYIENGSVVVECSPVKKALALSNHVGPADLKVSTQPFTRCEFPLSCVKNSPYVRIELYDGAGGMAFTNPLYL